MGAYQPRSHSVGSAKVTMTYLQCSFKFEVRQIMMLVSNDLQRKRHFCFDANPYAIGRRGLQRNRNVWRAPPSELSHFDLESTQPNKSPEPTAVGACRSAVAVQVARRRGARFFSFGTHRVLGRGS